MMSSGETITLRNGKRMPLLGFGTWLIPDEEVKGALHCALESGYRHIDTAYLYQNESSIGEVIQEWMEKGKLKREDLFISTKLPFIGNHPNKVEHFLKLSLEALKLDYVDLYLIHLPVGFVGKNDQDLYPVDENRRAVLDQTTDIVALWKAMEDQVSAGRARAIGLSNFNSKQIEKIVESAQIKPDNLQVELHAYFQQKRLREVCSRHDISVCAFATLGSRGRVEYYAKRGIPAPKIPAVLQDSVVKDIARIHSKSPAQILIRHLLQQRIAVIPKSINRQRIKDNFDILNFTLTEKEMEMLNSLDQNLRTFTFEFSIGVTDHPEYPFKIPF